MKSNYYLRQNHKKAITYLKSSLYCFNREKQLMYLVIICSSLFCVLGLVFSMLPEIVSEPSQTFKNLCADTITYLGFASGFFLVIQLFIKIISSRLHIEAVNSIERFDNYVYDLAPNRMIMRPMTEAQLDNNSTKIKSADLSFNNTYFQTDTDEDPLVVYNNQREIFINEYHLMLYVKSKFFNYLWLSFVLAILAFAFIVDKNFTSTLLNIFFPSISIISLIVSSILGYNRSMRFLQNTLTQFENAEKDPSFDRRCELTLRQNQDALFQYRMSSFTVPMFLIRMYERSTAKQLRNELASDFNSIPKTSPFITQEIKKRLEAKKNAKTQKKTSAPKSTQTDNFGQKAKAETVKKDAPQKPAQKKAEGRETQKEVKTQKDQKEVKKPTPKSEAAATKTEATTPKKKK